MSAYPPSDPAPTAIVAEVGIPPTPPPSTVDVLPTTGFDLMWWALLAVIAICIGGGIMKGVKR